MPDFEIRVVVKNVAAGDVEDVAQRIWDEHAADLDAKLGDFDVRVMNLSPGGSAFESDWRPLDE